ncbi:MAG: type II toxin-antitoxin system HicB family antitoxin [bacterium]
MNNHKSYPKEYTFRAIIEPDEPSGFHGYVPSLEGCHTCGDTLEETRANLREAIGGILETMTKHNIAV